MIQPRLIREAFPRPYLLAFVQENRLAQLVLGKSITLICELVWSNEESPDRKWSTL